MAVDGTTTMPTFQPYGRRAFSLSSKTLSVKYTQHFQSHTIGQNLVAALYLVAKETGKYIYSGQQSKRKERTDNVGQPEVWATATFHFSAHANSLSELKKHIEKQILDHSQAATMLQTGSVALLFIFQGGKNSQRAAQFSRTSGGTNAKRNHEWKVEIAWWRKGHWIRLGVVCSSYNSATNQL